MPLESRAESQPFTVADAGATTGSLIVPGKARLKMVSLEVPSGTPSHVAAIWLSDETKSINNELASGYVYGNGAPGGKLFWHGDIPIPSDRGTVSVKGRISNYTGTAFVGTLNVLYEEDNNQ